MRSLTLRSDTTVTRKSDSTSQEGQDIYPWASDAEIESFLRGETPPELGEYLKANFSVEVARRALDLGISSQMLLDIISGPSNRTVKTLEDL